MTSKPLTDTSALGFLCCVSWLFMTFGGLAAWGSGGMMFGCGLWLAFAMVCTTIERSTTKKEN